MRYSIYPQKDTTLYEASASMNAGIDAIAEVSKATTYDGNYNTRVLMQFDLTEISDMIASSSIANPRFKLRLWADEAKEIPVEYELEAHAVIETWAGGTGRSDNWPQTTVGAGWSYRHGADAADPWIIPSVTPVYDVNETGSWSSVRGGGNWYIAPSASQAYNFETADVDMDVTDIVGQWLSGSWSNNGFILKRTDAAEGDRYEYGSIKFYSSETNTVWLPRLEMAWDDSSFVTGSLTELTGDELVLYTKNLQASYREGAKAKVRVFGREKYPTRTYTTASNYRTVKYLPATTYYEVRDAYTEEVIVPFDDDYTKVSCDEQGNYLNLWINSFQPERFYKLAFKVVRESGSRVEYFDNDNFIFKVIR